MTASIAKYHCNYCDEDIRDVRVKCSECTDFDLCLQCFSCGAAIGPHKSNHGYQLIDCGTFPIFGPPDAWQASEELALLEAVELYGFGNWDDTSIYVGKKSPDDVQRHFITFFVDGAIGRVAWSRVPGSYKITDHSCPPDGPLSPTLTTPLVPLAELSYAEQTHLGYMPNRDDYEREYDNEAESLISTLAVNTNDDEEVDLDLKLAHVDMYRRRLADRSKMKSLARDYGLVVQFYKTLTADEEFMSQVSLQPSLVPQPSSAILPVDEDTNQSACSLTSKSSSTPSKKGKNHANSNKADASSIQPSERKDQLTEKFKSFSQFQSALDQKAMFDSLKKERELKARIRDLIRYRRSGLKKIGDVPEFEAARCKREKRKEKKKGATGSTVCEAIPHSETSNSRPMDTESLGAWDSPLGLTAPPPGSPVTGSCAASAADRGRSRALKGDAAPEKPVGAILVPEGRRSRTPSGAMGAASKMAVASHASRSSLTPETAATLASPASRSRRASDPATEDQLRTGDQSASKLPKNSSAEGPLEPFDVNSMPASRLLSVKEKSLCSSLRFKPSQYITYKTLLIKESQQSRRTSKGALLKSPLDALDKSVRRRLSAFLNRNGWLRTSAAG
ncbi:Transcriptional adapter 2-beta [Halotydeus destructor]|nr:Transcriptional adapter 2-beta [Halotydeus destructor]